MPTQQKIAKPRGSPTSEKDIIRPVCGWRTFCDNRGESRKASTERSREFVLEGRSSITGCGGGLTASTSRLCLCSAFKGRSGWDHLFFLGCCRCAVVEDGEGETCRDWCRGEIGDVSSLGPRLDGVLDGNVEPGWSFAVVEAPMIMEFVDCLPIAERPPTASDLDLVGVSLLALLLEALLLGEEIVRSNDNDSNAN